MYYVEPLRAWPTITWYRRLPRSQGSGCLHDWCWPSGQKGDAPDAPDAPEARVFSEMWPLETT